MKRKHNFTILLVLLLSFSTVAQTGGSYDLSHSVIASGGGVSNGGNFTLNGTTGQSLAGGLISNPPFDLFSGFWTPESVVSSLQFSSAVYSVNENGATATITVNRTGENMSAASVNYAASNGTAAGGAVCGGAGVDYQTAAGILNFAVGVMSQTFDVQICDDAIFEGDETLNLALSNAVGATLGTPNTAFLTIVDDDATPTPTPTPTPTGTVSGRVTYANALTTTSVPFTTLNAVGSIPLSTMTDTDGFYSISGFGSGAYTITPSKANQVNGISNLDASRIAQHIVGLTVLNANQLIAADTSGNGAVSNLDASFLAQFVASIPNPGITGTWKFLPANRSYPNIMTNQTNQDFSAILVGDVTGNWNPLGPLHPELSELEGGLKSQTDTTEQPVVVTAQTNESVGEETALTINLTATDTTDKDILGYQFELLYDAAVIEPQAISWDVADTISREMTAICHGSESGVLKVVVFGATPISGEGTLLRLNFKVVGTEGNKSPIRLKNFMFNEGLPTDVTIIGQW